MKFVLLIAVVVFLSFAQACGSSEQSTSKVAPVEASSVSETAAEVPLEVADLRPQVDVDKLVDWSSCQEAEMKSYERKRDRTFRAYEQDREENFKLYEEFEKSRIVEAEKFKAEDLAVYYRWLELNDRMDYDGLAVLRRVSPSYVKYEDFLRSHPYNLQRKEREAKHRAVSDAIEKVYKEERDIIDAKKRLLRQK